MKIKNLLTASLLTATMITSSFAASTAIQAQNDSYKIPYSATLTGKIGYSVSVPINGVDSDLITVSIDNASVNSYKLNNCVVYANARGNLAYESVELKPYKIICTNDANNDMSSKISGIITSTDNNILHGMITKSQFSKYPIMSIKASTPVALHLTNSIVFSADKQPKMTIDRMKVELANIDSFITSTYKKTTSPSANDQDMTNFKLVINAINDFLKSDGMNMHLNAALELKDQDGLLSNYTKSILLKNLKTEMGA